ncbi:MAG: hypothetical protein N3I35_02405 [Clostridia bacterium]|nr:hypothetical protein [Clostridia bacterium]
MLNLKISDINIDIMFDTDDFNKSDDTDCIASRFKAFLSKPAQANPDMTVYLKHKDYIPQPEGIVLYDEGIKWTKNYNNAFYMSISMHDIASTEIISLLEVNNKWSKACITCINDTSKSSCSMAVPLSEILFRNRILFYGGIILHASAIRWAGKGILFSAPAGTGKSTQAKLWKKLMGAEILNDDRPAVRIVDTQTNIYGTPWSGSTPCFSNSNSPLSAIILLEQSDENVIKHLSVEAALPLIMPRCFLPYHDSLLMEMALENLEKIIGTSPVYLLKCRPDKESVELVYRCIR